MQKKSGIYIEFFFDKDILGFSLGYFRFFCGRWHLVPLYSGFGEYVSVSVSAHVSVLHIFENFMPDLQAMVESKDFTIFP